MPAAGSFAAQCSIWSISRPDTKVEEKVGCLGPAPYAP